MKDKKRHSIIVCVVVLSLMGAVENLFGQTDDASKAVDSPSRVNETSKSDGSEDADLDFLEKDIHELSQTRVTAPAMQTEVTSVSRQKSTIGHTPAAVFVITNEMIRRSGYTTIPDLLRMAPGVTVAKISSHSWAVGIRGEESRFGRLLLVMIDGKSVYNPYFGGVYWDMLDLLFEDIDRIEVIRGPGGTVWGANAVDGVINIITKNAAKTKGFYATVGVGNYDKIIDGVRLGGDNGNGLSWRLWGKHFERGPGYVPGQGLGWDSWRAGHTGFQVDWDLDRCQCNHLTVLGNYSCGSEGQDSVWPLPYSPFYESVSEDMDFTGQNVLLRWEHSISEDSDWAFQTYYDRGYRKQYVGNEMWTTMDFDFQHRFPLGERNNVIWGLEYREIHTYSPGGSFFLSFNPEQTTYSMFSGFVQDEIELVEDLLCLTVGTKLEHNNFSGFEVQPSIRLLWSPDDRHSVWGAVSRPVATPVLYQETGTLTFGPSAQPAWPTFLQLSGNSSFKSEKLLAYELGYRAQVNDRFAWDVATYYNVYDDLHGFTLGMPVWVDPYWAFQSDWNNDAGGVGYGVELSASWDISDTWRLWGFYCHQYVHWEATPAESLLYEDGIIPLNQFRVQSSWTLTENCDFDAVMRYVDNMRGVDVPRYLTMDLRLAWRPYEHCELALVGQNLLDSHFYEFYQEPYGLGTTEVRRTVFGQLVWQR